MEDDLIAALTREVKEEVIENYLTERRIIEIQIDSLREQADQTRSHALDTSLRLARLGYLMLGADMLGTLKKLLGIEEASFWVKHLEERFARRVRFIRVHAIRERIKYRKLILESYLRLYRWMGQYAAEYEDLAVECRAVNQNIQSFQKRFDLLAILGFLRSLDTITLERKQYLGGNFTAEELASVDQKLYIPLIDFNKLDVPAPVKLPKPEHIEEKLSAIAGEVYRKHQRQASLLIR